MRFIGKILLASIWLILFLLKWFCLIVEEKARYMSGGFNSGSDDIANRALALAAATNLKPQAQSQDGD